jgi:hypothetical protein
MVRDSPGIVVLLRVISFLLVLSSFDRPSRSGRWAPPIRHQILQFPYKQIILGFIKVFLQVGVELTIAGFVLLRCPWKQTKRSKIDDPCSPGASTEADQPVLTSDLAAILEGIKADMCAAYEETSRVQLAKTAAHIVTCHHSRDSA